MLINFILITSIVLKLYFDLKYYRLINIEIEKPITKKTNTKKGVSVVICCKNELENLKLNINYIVNQDYENYEIIIVDDGSIDETYKYINKCFPSIKTIKTNDFKNEYPGKKNDLKIGVYNSKYDIILLTDADCKPKSNQWIKEMVKPFENIKTEIVLGVSHYKTYKGSFLNKIIQYDSFITAINYCSLCLAKQPYMGIGRNLAYRKQVFENSSILDKTKNIASGDDDLLINEISNKLNTVVCIKTNAITISEPKRTWKNYFIQKKRHFSTPNLYKKKDKIILTLYYFSSFSISFMLIISIVEKNYFSFLSLLTYKIISNKILLSKFCKILQYNHLLWYSPILEIFLIGLHPIIYINNILTPNKRWK